MKTIGAILIFLSAAFWGISQAKQIKDRNCFLKETISMLEIMKNEICTNRVTVKSILKSLENNRFIYISCFIDGLKEAMDALGEESMSEIWSECVNRYLRILSPQAQYALNSLGHSIGRYDIQKQSTAFDRCIQGLSAEEAEDSRQLKSNEKMYIGLGSGAGAIAALLLI